MLSKGELLENKKEKWNVYCIASFDEPLLSLLGSRTHSAMYFVRKTYFVDRSFPINILANVLNHTYTHTYVHTYTRTPVSFHPIIAIDYFRQRFTTYPTRSVNDSIDTRSYAVQYVCATSSSRDNLLIVMLRVSESMHVSAYTDVVNGNIRSPRTIFYYVSMIFKELYIHTYVHT